MNILADRHASSKLEQRCEVKKLLGDDRMARGLVSCCFQAMQSYMPA